MTLPKILEPDSSCELRGGLVLEWEHRDHSNCSSSPLQIWAAKMALWNITLILITSLAQISPVFSFRIKPKSLPCSLKLSPGFSTPSTPRLISFLFPPSFHRATAAFLCPLNTLSLLRTLKFSVSSDGNVLRWWSHGLIFQLLKVFAQIQFSKWDLLWPPV